MRWKHKDSLLRHRYNFCRITGKYLDGTPFRAVTDSEIGEALRNCTALDSELTRAAFKYHYLQEIGRVQRKLAEDYSSLWKLRSQQNLLEDRIAELENTIVELNFIIRSE